MPVLRDAAVTLWESNTICRYLAARERRTDLLPGAPAERARVEQWMDWQATELNTAWRYAFIGLVRHSPQHQERARIDASAQAWNRHLAILDATLSAGGRYVTGPVFTLADVVLGLTVHRWYSTPIQRPDLPAVAAYYERLSGRAGFRAYGRNGVP